MPYESWGCSICGMQASKTLREHGMFKERMNWLRHHYHLHHPDEFKIIIRKGARTRKGRSQT